MVGKKKQTKKTQEKTPVEKQLVKSFRRHARACGFKLQPDKKILDFVIKGELDRLKKYGALYCPCRRVTGKLAEDKKIICPCIYHKDEVKNDGMCKCRLYLRK
ncbi:ferredoxin:thioredoxin reductase [Candidatus Woesearchaeota archaeon]|nr:ferredoxin:thioredoxin reductase [Candidatus Woesearchaeota archaeon]